MQTTYYRSRDDDIFPNQGYSHYFFPLDMNDDGTYRCRVCVPRSDDDRYYYYSNDNNCQYGNETLISGKQLLNYRHIITHISYTTVLAVPPPKMEILVEDPLATVGSAMTMNCSVSVVPHLIASPRVELYGPEQLLLASGVTNFSLNHTLYPIKSLNAGLYVCKGVLVIRSARVNVDSQSFTQLSVQRRL